MALLTRFARLLRADLHAVLDRVEEPDVLLRQAVRDLEAELARDAAALAALEQERRRANAREEELRQALGPFEEELGSCLDAGKEDLARAVMKRKLETRNRLQLLTRRRDALNVRIAELGRRLEERRGIYEGLRQKADLLMEQDADAPRSDDWGRFDVLVRDEDVEVALLQEKQRRASS